MNKYKINLGSGIKRIDGYLNIDGDELCNPDYVLDIGKDNLPFPDNSISNVIAHHILEHMEGDKFFHLMKEIYRVSEDGAIIDIELPHHRHDVFYDDPSHYRACTVETFRLFSKTYNRWHIGHFGSSSGFGLRCDVDFEVIDYEHIFDPLFIDILKSFKSEDEKELFIKSTWNVIKYLKIKLQVIKNES